MRVLFIGGTGLISSACSALAVERGMELYLLNRGRTANVEAPDGARPLVADVRERAAVETALRDLTFDAVVDWIAFTPDHVQQDVELLSGRTDHYIFISSASAYQKPPAHYVITEDTPLANPHWQYSRDKAACEDRLMQAYRQSGFPVTIVRPSLTYGPTQIPVAVGSWSKPWTIVDRMRRGKKIIVHGDGTSLWTVTWNGDFAEGLVGLLGNRQAVGHAFHITSDEVLTWNQIYDEVARAAGAELQVVHVPSDVLAAVCPWEEGNLLGDKAVSAVFDNSKTKRFVPGFRCTVPFREGIRRTLAWFEADPARREVDQDLNATWDRIIAACESAVAQAQG
jgi:nucleoside-diphosphate-sugar epimerase